MSTLLGEAPQPTTRPLTRKRGILFHPLAFVRLILQSAWLAIGQIWANKTRSALTAVGIIIGVASVTAVIAALTGMRLNVLSQFESFGTNKIYIIPERPETGKNKNSNPWLLRFKAEEFDGLVEHCPSVSSFTRRVSEMRDVSYRDKTEGGVEVAGIDPGWHQIENRSVVEGRPFALVDCIQARPVCLINAKLRDKLALPRECVGESLMIADRRFTILGIIESRVESAMFGGGGAGLEVFIPFTTAWRMNEGFIIGMAASRSPEVSEDARAELTFYLRKQRHIKPDEPNTFRLEVMQQFLSDFDKLANAITMVAGGIVGISLLVGGVGIMNIMLVSVSERTREIGLRKAVGARPGAILLQFLVEAVMLCFLGGLVGIAIGEGLTYGLTKIPGAGLERAFIPSWAIALSFGFSAAVGLLFGMFPAIKAARLDPIEALRHE